MTSDNKELFAKADALSSRAIQVFKPRTPITTKELFAGRWDELKSVSDAVHQPGLHVVIYGERGVGKTSLANVVEPTIWALERYGMTDAEAEAIPERLVIKVVANSNAHEISGPDSGLLRFQNMSQDEIQARITELLRKREAQAQ